MQAQTTPQVGATDNGIVEISSIETDEYGEVVGYYVSDGKLKSVLMTIAMAEAIREELENGCTVKVQKYQNPGGDFVQWAMAIPEEES